MGKLTPEEIAQAMAVHSGSDDAQSYRELDDTRPPMTLVDPEDRLSDDSDKA